MEQSKGTRTMASSSSEIESIRAHEVYISSQKDDPVRYFADTVGAGLMKRGTLRAFQDENNLRAAQKGNIGKELREAIAMSKLAVVLCTDSYFGSSWCLEELVAILRCRERWGLIVLPIFFDIDPSDMRHLRGEVGKMVKFQEKGGPWYGRWKSAIKQVADFSGWVVQGDRGSQSMLVGNIIVDVEDRNIPTNLHISIYPFKYDNVDQYLNLFLQAGGIDDVHIVGIYGPRGMGKTAIAKTVFDQISCTFEGCCFLPDVGASSRRPNGLARMQQKLLSDLVPDRDVQVLNADIGMKMIKGSLRFKRVLVVFDDVDDLEQLYALVGTREWYGSGSKIVITTRNSHLLNVVGADQVFLAQGLPLPADIKAFWEQFQQSRCLIARLKQHIQLLHQQSIKRQTYLRIQLAHEQQRNVLQGTATKELEQAHVQDAAASEAVSGQN